MNSWPESSLKNQQFCKKSTNIGIGNKHRVLIDAWGEFLASFYFSSLDVLWLFCFLCILIFFLFFCSFMYFFAFLLYVAYFCGCNFCIFCIYFAFFAFFIFSAFFCIFFAIFAFFFSYFYRFCLLPSSASTSTSTPTYLKAEIALISFSTPTHLPNHPPTLAGKV